MNRSGSCFPSVISCSASSQRPVVSGLASSCGITSISITPLSVAFRVFPRRDAYPTLISRSMMAARVAGVPIPLPFIRRTSSSSSRSLPAVSMAASRLASVCGAGGLVWSSLTFVPFTSRVSPSFRGGSGPSSSSGFAAFFAFGGFSSGGTSCHPFTIVTRPFVRKVCSPTAVTTLVASYSQAG